MEAMTAKKKTDKNQSVSTVWLYFQIVTYSYCCYEKNNYGFKKYIKPAKTGREQYDKYFTSFSYKIKAKHEKREKHLSILQDATAV